MNVNPDPSDVAPELPPELSQRLHTMIRRVRRIIWLRGLLATGAVWFGAALALMAVDAAMPLESRAVRGALAGAALAAVLTTVWFSLVRPLSRRLSLMRMARVLETRHPELQERISSAIELLGMGGTAANRGSEQLVALLSHDAQSDVRGVEPRREFTGRSVKPALTAAAAITVVFGLLFAAWPRQTALLLTRAVAPYANVASFQGADLTVEPGDTIQLQGSSLTLRLHAGKEGVNERAEVRCLFAGGQETVERMHRTPASTADAAVYELTFPCVTESFRYRIRLGLGLSRDYTITVLEPPALNRLAIHCAPPAYTRQESRDLAVGVRDIAGVAGTRVRIEAGFNRPADALLLLGDQRLPGGTRPAAGAVWNLVLSTNMADSWAVSLRDAQGFTSTVEYASLKVVPDRPPSIEMRSPQADTLTLPPYGQVTFAFGVSEDFGLSRAELVLHDGLPSSGEKVTPFALQAESPEVWAGTQDIDLARMQLQGVRQFDVQLRVADTLPPELGGPQRAESRVVRITLDVNAKRMEDQLREEQKKTLEDLLRAAAERLTQGAELVTGVRDRTSDEPLKPAVAHKLAEAQERASTSEDLVKRAGELCAKSYFSSLAQRIDNTALTEVEPARTATEEILLMVARQRPEKSTAAVAALQNAAAKVLALIAAIEELDRKLAEVSKTDELAQREKALAEQAAAERLTQAEREAWQKEQDRIAKELAAEKQADPAATKQAEDQMAAAMAAMAADQAAPQNDPAQQAARQAASAAQQAANAADLAAVAASNAEKFADNRQAAKATEDAAALAEKAALQAEQAAKDSLKAANREQAAEQAAEAKAQQQAAQLALLAAETALQSATQSEHAAHQADAAARQQEQGHADAARQQAQTSDRQAQVATNLANQAQTQAERAADQARTEQAPVAGEAAQLAKDAAVLSDRAADLSREAANQAQQAGTLQPEQREAQTQQAADKAQQAAEMARQAEAKALEAIQKATAAQTAAQQAQQAAQQDAGQQAQIQAAAQQAGQEAQQAAQTAQQAAAAAQQAIAQTQQQQDPVMQQAAQQTAEASKLADQAAALANKAEQRIEKTAAQDPLQGAAEDKQAAEEAKTAMQLAQQAAQLAQQAAKTARGELDAEAQTAQADAQAAVQDAGQAAQAAQAAAQQAQQAAAPAAAQAAQLGQQAAQLAQQAGQLVQQAMQTAGQNTPATDTQAAAMAQQAAAKAAQAAAMAQQAGAQAQSQQAASPQAQAAAAAAAQAAASMSQMAQAQAAQSGQSMTPPTQWNSKDMMPPGEMNSRQDTKNLGQRNFMPVFLANLGFPEAEWARFKGKNEAQALEEALKTVPPEYRDLVRRYFTELAREGGKQAGGRP